MTQTNNNSQECLAGALASLVFFLPLLMDKRTEFTTHYMRQSFILFLLHVGLSLVAMVLPFFGALYSILHTILVLSAFFLAWKAYNGERFSLPYIAEWGISVVKAIGMEKAFSPNK